MDALPDLPLNRIAFYLNTKDLINFSKTCKGIYSRLRWHNCSWTCSNKGLVDDALSVLVKRRTKIINLYFGPRFLDDSENVDTTCHVPFKNLAVATNISILSICNLAPNRQTISMNIDDFSSILSISSLRHLTLHRININIENGAAAKTSDSLEVLSQSAYQSQLKTLDMRFQTLSAQICTALSRGFALGNKSIISLWLSHNHLPADVCDHLVQGLAGCSSLQHLYLCSNQFDDNAAVKIAKCIESHPSICSISLDSCPISSSGAEAVASALSKKSLCSISIQSTKGFNERSLEAIAKLENTERVYLGFYEEQEIFLDAFSRALARNKGIQELYIWRTIMGKDAGQNIAFALEHNTSVKILRIPANQIGEEGGSAIIESLSRNKHLLSLDLSENNLGSQVASSLEASLDKNETLERLDVSHNYFGPENAQSLGRGIASCLSLTEVYAINVNMRDAGLLLFSEALKSSRSLSKLSLSNNEITDTGIGYFVGRLLSDEKRPLLLNVDFSDNKIGNNGATMLARAKYLIPQLTLDNNLIGKVGAMRLISAFTKKKASMESYHMKYKNINVLNPHFQTHPPIEICDLKLMLSCNHLGKKATRRLKNQAKYTYGRMNTLMLLDLHVH